MRKLDRIMSSSTTYLLLISDKTSADFDVFTE